MFIGNKKNEIFFEKAVINGCLSHAHCFCGPENIGKMTLVKKIASRILSVPENEVYQNPNFYYFEKSVDEKTGKVKKEITIAQAREIRDKMTKKSWNKNGQVLVLNGAQYLNAESGNALLKALEEPAEKSFLFLLGDHEKNILPTVLSRCQKTFFLPVNKKDIFLGLKEKGYDKESAEIAATFAGGLPGRAIAIIENKEIIEELKTEARKWLSLLKMNFTQRLEELENILSEKDGNKVRENLINKFNFWLELWRELLIFKINNKNDNPILKEGELTSLNYNPVQIQTIIEEIINSQNYLKNNVQTRLVVERLLLKF